MFGTIMSVSLMAIPAIVVIAVTLIFGLGLTTAIMDLRRRNTSLKRIFREDKATHSVGPDTPVSECARLMTNAKIGALVILQGERLIGIFTERDVLNKVVARGIDPARTKVSDVMTSDPYCIPSTTTVSDVLKLISSRRFRHLPIEDNGKFLTVVSSGDLTHWLLEGQVDSVKSIKTINSGRTATPPLTPTH